jgi:hypothetical protein
MTPSAELVSFHAEAKALANRFRSGQSLEAALELEPLLSRFLPALSEEQLSTSLSALRSMLACQEVSDWIGLADWLEYDLWAALHMEPRP